MRNKISKEDKNRLLEVISVLAAVDNRQPIFFNIQIYENEAKLVRSVKRYHTDASGNRQISHHEYFLTEKGRRILNSAEIIKAS